MSITIPPLYAITDDRAAEGHVEQVRELVGCGVRFVQIRAKCSSGRELYDIVVSALEIARESGARIVVNDRVDVALASGADGVHVGQDDLPAGAARAILGPDAIVGISTHSVEQARAAAQLPVDYVAIGPIFPTATKTDADPVVGLEGLAAVREAVDRPLVAIGGIQISNAAAVFAAGADSVAVVSGLRAGGSLEDLVRAYNSLRSSRS